MYVCATYVYIRMYMYITTYWFITIVFLFLWDGNNVILNVMHTYPQLIASTYTVCTYVPAILSCTQATHYYVQLITDSVMLTTCTYIHLWSMQSVNMAVVHLLRLV